jgi:hypothetical protein
MSSIWAAVRLIGLSVAAGLQMLLYTTVVLWGAGPLPLDTGCYVQAVSSDSALVCKVDGDNRTLRFDLLRDGHKVQSKQSGPTTLHAVRFDDLESAARYTYLVQALDEASPVSYGGEFRTAPIDDRTTVRFTAVGDSGDLPWWHNFHHLGLNQLSHVLSWTEEPWQWEIARWIAAQDSHFFVHLGDIVYWRDLYDAHGEAFFRPFEPVLRRTPIYMVAGNHDLESGLGSSPFDKIFHHPESTVTESSQRSYSFSFGSVRVIAFDVMTSGWRDPATLAGFRKELEEASEPWLIVAIHRPCFSVYRTEDAALRDELWPILHEYGVDLVISGDDHHYARFRQTDADSTSPIQLIAGGGGKKLYAFNEQDPRLVPGKSKSAWSFLSFEAKGLQLHCRAMSSAEAVLDAWTLDRRQGKLAPGIRPGRRERILRLRR